jgi:hypothetical protein
MMETVLSVAMLDKGGLDTTKSLALRCLYMHSRKVIVGSGIPKSPSAEPGDRRCSLAVDPSRLACMTVAC